MRMMLAILLFPLLALADTVEWHGMGRRVIKNDGSIDPGHGFLYTKPDPSSEGGIQGVVASPALPIEQVLAIPADEPRFVYQATITDPDRRSFYFKGLPMRKYDLIVIYADRFYEGLRLHRQADTLTPEDRTKIKAIVDASEPYFKAKHIHRLEGTTGRGNKARAICTFFREAPSLDGHPEYRRTFKVVQLKDVGPGWQIVRARDLYPVSFQPGTPLPRHNFTASLSGIRVTRSVKDLGQLKLKR